MLGKPSNNALQAMWNTGNINLLYLTFMKLITLLCQSSTRQSLERGDANKSLLVCLSVTACLNHIFSSTLSGTARREIKCMCHSAQLDLRVRYSLPAPYWPIHRAELPIAMMSATLSHWRHSTWSSLTVYSHSIIVTDLKGLFFSGLQNGTDH